MKDLRIYLVIIRFFAADGTKVFVSLVFAAAYAALLLAPVLLMDMEAGIMLYGVWAVLLNVFHLLVKFASLKLSNARINVIREAFVNHLSKSGLAETEHLGANTRMALISSTLDHISLAGSALYGQATYATIVLFVAMVIGSYFAGWMTVFLLPIAGVLWLANQLSIRRVKRDFENHHSKGREVNAEIMNITSNYLYYKSTRLFEARAFKLFQNLRDFGQNTVKIRTFQYLIAFINQNIIVVVFVLFAKIFNEGLSVSQLMVWTVLGFELKKLLLGLFQSNSVVLQGGLSLDKISDFLHFGTTDKELEDSNNSWTFIEWTDLHFTYPSSTKSQYYKGARIAKGSRIWIEGANGAGKTTLWKLILGFYKPSDGTVKILPSESNIDSLLLNIGIVTEPVYLLPGILWNFLGGEKMDKSLVIESIEALGFAPFIEEIADTYDHVLGLENKKLSKGQTKVVMFLQALLGKPEVLVLDEPFASVDSHWTVKMIEAIEALPKETTVIYISHQTVPITFDSVLNLNKDAS
ncbi:ABC transporter ATP-binding protein/permease [Flavobacteriales bacterium]|nr:ABC transporter ATP-binding protein/permease [Flavobacteriales bacterium]